jgi:hypothetical protein
MQITFLVFKSRLLWSDTLCFLLSILFIKSCMPFSLRSVLPIRDSYIGWREQINLVETLPLTECHSFLFQIFQIILRDMMLHACKIICCKFRLI